MKKITNFFCYLFKKNKRAKLRRVMRGYRLLLSSGQADRISLLKNNLTTHNLNLIEDYFSSHILGAGIQQAELILRQYLLLRIGYLNLNAALLESLDKKNGIIFPLPKIWRQIITNHGFKVSSICSAALWWFYIFGAFIFGIYQIVNVIFFEILSLFTPSSKQSPYIYFAGLTKQNFPATYQEQPGYDILSWYLNWPGRQNDLREIRHSVLEVRHRKIQDLDITFQRGPLPSSMKIIGLIKYVIWAIGAIAIAAFDCFRGRWWHAFILNQAALSAKARYSKKENLAAEYLFHNSGWIYRPLWTYDAEKKGSTITLYFYSTNNEAFQTSDSYKSMYIGYQSMTWSRYLVWDEFQANFVRRAVGDNAVTLVVGPIGFVGGGLVKPLGLNNLSIIIFDVTPHRSSRYSLLAPDDDFHTPEFINTYLDHVISELCKYTFPIFLKPKRDIGKLSHPLYRKMLSCISQNNKITLLDPSIPAEYLIKNSFAVISSPYTSTAIIAKEMGKPSIYYDPSGLLRKSDRAAHGVSVIQGRAELESWLSSLANS